VLGELEETPFEPLEEEQDEGMTGMSMWSPIAVLNNTLINLLEGNMLNPKSSFSPALLIECQICEERDHIATTCPRLNAPWPKCARCDGPHRITSCGMGHTHCSGLGYSEGRNWRMPNERKLHLGEANFLEALLNGEKATITIEDETPQQQPVVEFAKEGTYRINVLIEDELQARITQDAEFRIELSDTKEERLNAAENKISVEALKAMKEIDNIPELNDEAATIQQDQAPLVDDETDDIHEAVDDQIAIKLVQDEGKISTLGAQDIKIISESEEVEELFTSALPPSVVDEDPEDPRTMVRCTDGQQNQVTRATSKMVDVSIEAFEQGDPYSGMELPDSFVRPCDLFVVPMQVIGRCSRGHEDDILLTVSRNAYKQNPYEQESGISNSNQITNVEARTLPHQRLSCHDASREECIPSVGQRNMRYWTCINFSRYVPVEIAPQLCNELIKICLTSGVVFEMNPVLSI
jgi:hypothetical protein